MYTQVWQLEIIKKKTIKMEVACFVILGTQKREIKGKKKSDIGRPKF